MENNKNENIAIMFNMLYNGWGWDKKSNLLCACQLNCEVGSS